VTPALDGRLNAVLQAGIPGVVVVAGADGSSREAATGISDLATGAPLTLEHRFRIASVTKLFVAAVVLQLAGPRLQCRLADLVGVGAPGAVPAAAPAPMPACGSTESDAAPMRPCKVATMAAADVAVGPQF